jgi:hypothetical protein
VVEVPALSDVQDVVYAEPTILLAKQVSGEEEIPENVVAVITPDAPDILSHSSVRARNMKVRMPLMHASTALQSSQKPSVQRRLRARHACGFSLRQRREHGAS